MSRRRIGSLLATILFLAVLVTAAFNVERIQDEIVYRQFEPSSAIAALVDESGMSERGRFLFYTSQPSLESAESFNQHCSKHEKTTAILGCYDGQKIYIYDIPDPRLAGIRPTTAAHEMLHAGYRRLSDKDREMAHRLLEAEYEKLKDDEELTDRMAFYARTQPGERENELHSIIGTEIAEISDELEEYYKRYFTDRSKVIAQHQQYFSLFEQLRSRADSLDRRIDVLEKQVKDDRAAYNTRAVSLQQDINNFNARAGRGDFESQAAFNSERQALMARSATLESLRTRLNNAISEYNRLVAELGTIATETSDLNRSLDSNLAPAPNL